MVERIVASLVYDTRAQPLSSGIRAVVQRARRMLYTADETEVVLQIGSDKHAEQLKLAGQVLDEGMPVAGAAVNLQGPSSQIERETDEEGEFQIGALPRGTYSLEIGTSERLMSVSPIDID